MTEQKVEKVYRHLKQEDCVKKGVKGDCGKEVEQEAVEGGEKEAVEGEEQEVVLAVLAVRQLEREQEKMELVAMKG